MIAELPRSILTIGQRRSGRNLDRMPLARAGVAVPSPILPRNLRKMKFLDMDPLEIARQLTLKDAKLFAKIPAVECLSKAWPKLASETPRILDMIKLNNAVSCPDIYEMEVPDKA